MSKQRFKNGFISQVPLLKYACTEIDYCEQMNEILEWQEIKKYKSEIANILRAGFWNEIGGRKHL